MSTEHSRRLECGPLAGMRSLVTAGPTVEPIDPVRFLSNRSSGRQGYAIAEALAELGADVTLISGPTSLEAPASVRRVHVQTAEEMLNASLAALPVDVAVMVAAVADWRPKRVAGGKIKKGAANSCLTLALEETPDILSVIAAPGALRPALVVGFAAETSDVEVHARAKIARKGCDWIVANDVSGDVMGGAENQVVLITRQSAQVWPRMLKHVVAQKLAAEIHKALAER